MLKFLFGAQRQVRQLNRDAATIVGRDRRAYGPDHLRRIAENTREELDYARERLQAGDAASKQALARIKELHRVASRSHDQVALSAMSLVIIYLRCERYGEQCDPARRVIDEFIDEFAGPEGAGTPAPPVVDDTR